MNLNINEIILIFAIFALSLYVLLKSFNSKFWIKAFQPQVFISLNILEDIIIPYFTYIIGFFTLLSWFIYLILWLKNIGIINNEKKL